MVYKISEADKTTRDWTKELDSQTQRLQIENEQQSEVIEKQFAKIEELEELSGKLENLINDLSLNHNESSQKIDEIEGSFAMFSDEVENKFENLPATKSNPIVPFLLVGTGILGVLISLGLSLDVKFGESKISYQGEGVTGGLVQIAIAAVSGGLATQNIKPIRDLLNNNNNNT